MGRNEECREGYFNIEQYPCRNWCRFAFGFKPLSLGAIDNSKINPIDEPVFNPKGSVGSAHSWSITARVQCAKLPRQGKIRYIPPKNYSPSAPLPKGPNNGYLDKFGNEWTKGPSRTKGQEFEWDVQLSKTGREQLGWASRDGKHLNISIDGKITHK